MREGLEDARERSEGEDGDVLLSVVGADPSDPAVLLLRAGDGRTFRLPADARLRAALRGAAPSAPAAPAASAKLTPRDIQARIRAGESAADVAADAGVPIEQVRRYEGPVMAERAHVAALARLAVVRGGPGRLTLEEAVRARLLGRGTDPGATTWDAWRRDRSWAVQVSFRAAGRDRSAQWSFSPASRALEPLDDEARWLTSPGDDTGRRLAAVRVYDVDEDGGGLDEAGAAPAGAVGSGLHGGVGDAHGSPRASQHAAGGGAPEADGHEPSRDAGSTRAATPAQAPGAPAAGAPEPPVSGRDGDVTGALDALDALADPAEDEDGATGADDLASRTLDLLDALRDRRGRRVPLDLGPDGSPWDDDEEDDDLLNALLDLPPGSHPDAAELQEEVDRARARLRMVTPPRGLSLGGDRSADQDGEHGQPLAPDEVDAPPHRASLGLVPAPPPTAPVAVSPTAPAPTAAPVPSPSPSPSPAPAQAPAQPPAQGRAPAEGQPMTRRELRGAGRAETPAGTGASWRDDPATAAPPEAAPPAGEADEPEHDGDDPGEQPARRRRSVPSWDEIVFGVPRRD